MLLVRIGPPRLVVATEMRSKGVRLDYGRRSTVAGLCHGNHPEFAWRAWPLHFGNFWRGSQVSAISHQDNQHLLARCKM